MSNAIGNDLDSILEQTLELWEQVRGSRLFITGGTGFFGNWLVESFLHANRRLNLRASVGLLTRDPEVYRASRPRLASDPSLTLFRGDIRNFDFPPGHFSHVIHAATPASAALNSESPLTMLDTIVDGTRHTLDFAVSCGARRFLLTSSGAVYGRQPSKLSHQPEIAPSGPVPVDPNSAYAEGKRVAELLCSIYSSAHGLETLTARCFAFVGPWLPVDAHFAAGNFIRDYLGGGPIRVKGDGSAVRSYLYASDLAVWLWTILMRGESVRPYNVGSNEAISILELAHVVAGLRPGTRVEVAGRTVSGAEPDRYVPDVSRAQRELGLTRTVDLEEAFRRTAQWHGRNSCAPEPVSSSALVSTSTVGA